MRARGCNPRRASAASLTHNFYKLSISTMSTNIFPLRQWWRGCLLRGWWPAAAGLGVPAWGPPVCWDSRMLDHDCPTNSPSGCLYRGARGPGQGFGEFVPV